MQQWACTFDMKVFQTDDLESRSHLYKYVV